MIEQMGLSATILCPFYFMNNDMGIEDVVIRHGVYLIPVGTRERAVANVRDVGKTAAVELLRCDRSSEPLLLDKFDVAGSDSLTSAGIAGIWSEAFGRRSSIMAMTSQPSSRP